MAKAFLRIDLSENGKFFHPVALEPGCPLIDPTNANDRIIFRWFRGMTPEPEWADENCEIIQYYLRNDQGARLEDIDEVLPVTNQDLKELLASEIERLQLRFDAIRPVSTTEKILYQRLSEEFHDLIENTKRLDRTYYFFKYQDGGGFWRLIWIPGYTPRSQEGGTPMICDDEECSQLYLRLPKAKAACPICAHVPTAKRKALEAARRKRNFYSALLLLLLLIGWVTWNQFTLLVKPGVCETPVGTQVDFRVMTPGLDGFGLLFSKDVTRSVLSASEDPSVAAFLEHGTQKLLAVTPGETNVRFQTGLRRKTLKFKVAPPTAAHSVWIESSREDLAVGTTAQVRLLGKFSEDGTVADLTQAAKWEISADSPIYFNDGFIEAKTTGKAALKAVYSAPGDTQKKEAVLELTVTKAPIFTEIAVELPNEGLLTPAARVNYRVIGKTAEKAEFDLTGSSKLEWKVTPANALTYRGAWLETGAPGAGNLAVSYAQGGKKLDASAAFTVGTNEKLAGFQVFPAAAEMAVDQKLPVSFLCADLSAVRAVSSNPEIVEVDQDLNLIARDAGEAQVTFTDGSSEFVMPVKTTAAKADALHVLPPRVNVPQDHASSVLFLAEADSRFHLLANDAADLIAEPDEAFAKVDPIRKSIFGRSGTTTPELAVYGYQARQASAEVAVNVPPLKFEIRPAKELKLPLGLCQTFTGIAEYGDGVRAFVDNSRIAWAISPDPETAAVPAVKTKNADGETAESDADEESADAKADTEANAADSEKETPQTVGTPGLKFENGRAMAYAEGAGPFQVWGTYCAQKSDPVTVTTVEAADVELAITVDRTLRIEGEAGKAFLTGRTADGDVELVPGLAKFTSTASDKVAVIDEKDGVFKAVLQGSARLNAEHPASKKAASLDLLVVHPRHLEMYWAPETLDLAVGEAAPFQLRLKVRDPKLLRQAMADTGSEKAAAEKTDPEKTENAAQEGTADADADSDADADADSDAAFAVDLKDSVWDVPMMSPGVYCSIEQPDAVAWHTATLTGLRPAEPFRITASYLPYLKDPAVAVISVGQKDVEALRVTPSEVTLAPGQSLSLKVEAKIAGTDDFREVAPEAVRWTIPRNVLWTEAENGIRPFATAPDDGTQAFPLTASFGKKTAACQVTVAEPKLDPNDRSVKLVLVRHPAGAFLPVGQSQSYEIWMEKGSVREPAPNVFWTPDFSGTSVHWDAPVLTALEAGGPVFLTAQVGERLVTFWTQPIDTSVQGEKAPLREGQPETLRIFSDDGEEVTVPVGAVYTNYYVEAEYPDGFIQIVTKDATLHAVAGDPQSVTPANGELVAVKKGTVTYVAEYAGAETETKLTLNVTENVDIDELRLEPDKSIRMMPGETVQFKLHGFKEGKSVGLLTGMGNITWNSSDPTVAAPQGPVTTANALGKADITATLNGVVSAPAGVEVVATIDEKLGPTDNVIKMMVGESRLVGKDFALIRGNVDFSMQCTVTPLVPDICAYDPSRHALVGKTPGATDVIFTMGDKKAVMRAVVGGVDAETVQKLRENGKVIVEPAVVTLSAGQMIAPSVYAVTDDGIRLERTNGAIFRSTDPEIVEVRGLWLCAKKPGTVAISAQIPEVPGRAAEAASITVDANPISELVVEPGMIQMSTGDKSNLFIQGRSASGLRRMFEQPALKVESDGPAAAMNGIHQVEARSAGKANINVDWNSGQLKKQVPVQVDDNPYSDLAIDPLTATVAVGEGRAYQVTAKRGGRLYVIQPDTGLELTTKDPNIAVVQNGLVFGRSAGRTSVIARFAGLVSEGVLEVVEPGTIPASVEAAYIDPDAAVIYRPTDTVLDGGVVGVTSTDIFGDDAVVSYVTEPGVVNGTVVGLRFMDSALRLSKTGSAVAVEVFEELADGRLGRNVSADPELKLNFDRTTATAELSRGADGRYLVRPLGEKRGTVLVNAALGSLTSAVPLAINIGDVSADGASLDLLPGLLYLVAGGSGTLDAAQVNPGNGTMPFDVAYEIVPPADSSIVSVGTDGQIRANAPGNVTLVVKAVDPAGTFSGLTATLPVTVSPRLDLKITPQTLTIRDGETTPAFVVSSIENGAERPVAADIASTDSSVLASLGNGIFQAVGPGKTQVWGSYMGNELYADVTVIGERYLKVESELGSDDSVTGEFSIRFSVLASKDEGALEYRVYQEGQAPSDVWMPASPAPDGQVISIESPKIDGRFGNEHVYRLIIESRTRGQQNIQQYPCSFRLFHQGRQLQNVN